MTDLELAEILNTMWDEIDVLKRQNALLMAYHMLDGGLLPDVATLTMLEAQVWYKETLTSKQRQGGHTNWSLRLRASVNGKKIKKEINVALFNGRSFAQQVLDTTDPIPPTIHHFAESVSDRTDDDMLLGMFKQLTSGDGSPRSRRQFAILSGHLENRPMLAIYVDDAEMVVKKFGPSKGTKANRSKWWGTWARGKGATLS